MQNDSYSVTMFGFIADHFDTIINKKEIKLATWVIHSKGDASVKLVIGKFSVKYVSFTYFIGIKCK